MADAAFAMQSRAATQVTRNDRAPSRPFGATEARTGDFSRGLDSASNVAGASFAPAAARPQQPQGRGMLSTSVQFVLAETRTQEAGAPLPPISSLSRARDSYLSSQASVRETIAFARMLASEQVRTAASADANAQAEAAAPRGLIAREAGYSVNQLDDEFDSDDY